MRWAWPLWLAVTSLPLHAAVRPCSPDELRQQLLHARTMVAACSTSAAPAVCDPSTVGPDDQVALAGSARRVEFAWLRQELADAHKSKDAAAALKGASQRIDRELTELAAPSPLTQTQLQQEQTKLRGILNSGAFPQPQPESFWKHIWDEFLLWLQAMLLRAGSGTSNSQWISQIIMLALLGLGAGGLLWWVLRVSRRPATLLKRTLVERAPSASAGPDWETWIEQARQLAQQQQWREAIHRVYWTAISRMESRGSWRPDPSRTPRDYLDLIDRQSPSRNDLALLTRALEQFWYGGRPASEQDYTDACRSLDRLAAA